MDFSKIHILIILGLSLYGCATTTEKGTGKLTPVASAGVTDSVKGDRYGLVVGIDEFEDDTFNDLRYAVSDARAVSKRLGGFDKIVTLTKSRKTHRTDILAALERLQKRVDHPSDTIFIYFSTHGTLTRTPKGELKRILVIRDTRLDVAEGTGIPVQSLVDKLDETPSERRAIVLATCYSGSGKSKVKEKLSQKLASRKSPVRPPIRAVSEASGLFSASAFHEPARESSELGHGIYTHFFLEGLTRGDRDGDGAVTITEAHDHARKRTYAFTEGRQRPSSWIHILGDDPIVLRGEKKKTGKPVIYSYKRGFKNVEVAAEGGAKGSLPGGVALEPGRQKLTVRDSETNQVIWRGTVNARAGERIEVLSLLPSATQWRVAGGLGVVSSTGGEIGDKYFPMSVGFRLGASVRNALWESSLLGLDVTGFGANSGFEAFDRRLSYQFRGIYIRASIGHRFQISSDWSFSARGSAGLIGMTRQFDTGTYRDTEAIMSPVFSSIGSLEWSFSRSFMAQSRLELGAFRAELGAESSIHPIGSFTVGIGATF